MPANYCRHAWKKMKPRGAETVASGAAPAPCSTCGGVRDPSKEAGMKNIPWAGSFVLALLWLGLCRPPAAGPKDTVIDSDDPLAIAFSPNGRILAAAGFGKAILVWDARKGNVLCSLEGPKRTTRRSIAFSPDDKTLIG